MKKWYRFFLFGIICLILSYGVVFKALFSYERKIEEIIVAFFTSLILMGLACSYFYDMAIIRSIEESSASVVKGEDKP